MDAEVLQWLNGLGLPLLGTGMLILYRALAQRSSILGTSLEDLKGAYSAVLDAVTKRSDYIQQQVEYQRQFNQLYLSMVADSEKHKEKIKEWTSAEVQSLEHLVAQLRSRLGDCQSKYHEVYERNGHLREDMRGLELRCKELERVKSDLETAVRVTQGGLR